MRILLALAVGGCGSGSLPEVAEPGPDCAAVSVSPADLTWRDTRIGEAATRAVEITNGCDVQVFVHTFVDGPPLFTVDLGSPFLEPGEVRSVPVEFTAADGQLQEAVLGIRPWGGDAVDVDLEGRAESDWDGDGYLDSRAGGGDCDDDDPAVNPEAAEICNGVDDDCSGEADDLVVWWYADSDRDGWGAGDVAGGCVPGRHMTDSDGDCDDADPFSYPGAEDPPCDGVDQSCDGLGDEVAAMIGNLEYGTIQGALDGAGSGDIVEVCPGTHTEALVGQGRDLVLTSRSGDPADTVLDGEGDHRILTLVGGQVAVSHLGFTRGYDDEDGGGALHAEDVELSLLGCTFTESEAVEGGAALVRWSEDATWEARIQDCTFEGNAAVERGGALALVVEGEGIDVVLDGCALSDNHASTHGGGLYWRGSGAGSLTLEDCELRGNSAVGGGGARLVGQGDPVVVLDSTFTDNHARSGGGLDALGEVEVQRSSFLGNTSTGEGAGAYLVGEGAFEETTFDGNIAVARGAALYASGSTTLDTCTITDNETTAADPGGAVYLPAESDLVSTDTDWGTGSTDNTPADLCTASGCDADLGASETFTCSDGAC